MNRILMSVLIVSLLGSGCATQAMEGIEIRDAWTRPAAQGQNGAVYFVIHNGSSQEDEITGVASVIAEAAEIHESLMSGDVMEMHHLESVPLQPGSKIVFEPGGLHIMLIGLKEDLTIGDEIEITLQFRNSADVKLKVPVEDTAAHKENH